MSESELHEVMTVDEAAAYLRVNRKTIYDAVKRNEMPGAQWFGRAIRIRKEEVINSFVTGMLPAKQRKRTR